jgi:hypothetical protein
LKKTFKVRDYEGSKRIISKIITLDQCITYQDFVKVLAHDYTAAARFILDWYSNNKEEAVNYIVNVLSIMREELDLHDSYYRPYNSSVNTLEMPEGSTNRVGTMRFCELLYEAPNLVRAITKNQRYHLNESGYDFFKNRELNMIAIQRDTWCPDGFINPEPIPRELIDRALNMYDEAEMGRRQAEEDYKKVLEDKKKQNHAERIAIGSKKVVINRQESMQKKEFRQRLQKLSIDEQVKELIKNKDYPIQVFPVEAKDITSEILFSLTNDQRIEFLKRISKRRSAEWTKLRKELERLILANDA